MKANIHLSNKLARFFFCLVMGFLYPILSHAQLPTVAVDYRPYSTQCMVKVLKNMGWSFNTESAENSFSAPKECVADSLTKLQPELQINMNPSSNDERALRFNLEMAYMSSGTNCAFQTRLAEAALTATKKLKRNKLYIFTPFWTKDDIRLGTLKKEWQQTACYENSVRCFVPTKEKKSKAIEALYGSVFSSDCGVGLELAEYATIKELFGAKAFDTHFTNPEIFVGDIVGLPTSSSFTRGAKADRILPANGLSYAKSGYRNFIGVSGYVGSVFNSTFLDDQSNQNENFMIVNISKAASDQFLKNGGLSYYEEYMHKAWELSQKISKEELRVIENLAFGDRLEKATDITVQMNLPPESGIGVGPTTIEFLTMLQDPFLNETQIYVHPFGPRNIAWHIARLAQLNPRTPYMLRFYPDVMHRGVLNRWVKSQLDDCQSGSEK